MTSVITSPKPPMCLLDSISTRLLKDVLPLSCPWMLVVRQTIDFSFCAVARLWAVLRGSVTAALHLQLISFNKVHQLLGWAQTVTLHGLLASANPRHYLHLLSHSSSISIPTYSVAGSSSMCCCSNS